jgi:hypothetical protein
MYIGAQTTNQSIFSTLKVHYYIFGVYMLQYLFTNVFFLQVEYLNLAIYLEKYYFNAMFIACKCMQFYKKLDCDTKSEPPYFATTF